MDGWSISYYLLSPYQFTCHIGCYFLVYMQIMFNKTRTKTMMTSNLRLRY